MVTSPWGPPRDDFPLIARATNCQHHQINGRIRIPFLRAPSLQGRRGLPSPVPGDFSGLLFPPLLSSPSPPSQRSFHHQRCSWGRDTAWPEDLHHWHLQDTHIPGAQSLLPHLSLLPHFACHVFFTLKVYILLQDSAGMHFCQKPSLLGVSKTAHTL